MAVPNRASRRRHMDLDAHYDWICAAATSRHKTTTAAANCQKSAHF
jgi:hypothetical protein